jgi:hypothetical protein
MINSLKINFKDSMEIEVENSDIIGVIEMPEQMNAEKVQIRPWATGDLKLAGSQDERRIL